MATCRNCHRPITWEDRDCPHCGTEHAYGDDSSGRSQRRRHDPNAPNPYRHPIARLFIPDYHRLAVFMMAVSVLLVFANFTEARESAMTVLSKLPRGIAGLLGAGLLYALFYGVTTVSINKDARSALLCFALGANLCSGLASAYHQSLSAHGWTWAFPILNLFNCLVLISLLFTSLEDERFHEAALTDIQTNRFGIGLAYAMLIATFVFCDGALQLHWSIIFSICILFATNISRYVEFLFSNPSRNRQA